MAALVIGNAAYPDGPLANPANDAHDIAVKLRSYGFSTTVSTDCTYRDMDKLLKKFRESLEDNDVGLFFFAGHGIQIDGVNYLIAVDTDMDTEPDAKHSSLSLDKVVDIMAKSATATRIIILDACRTNPWERRWHRAPGTRGLASVYAPKGTIIAFATSPGEFAGDGIGRNGTYTAALLQHIDTPDCSIESMFKRVRNEVAAASGGKQTSWEHTSLSGEFYFNIGVSALVDEYNSIALADDLFILDESKHSHRLIKKLKSHNWYQQNSAMAELNSNSIARMAKNSVFVIGRNIYQAACGTARDAVSFIKNFADETSGYDPEKRKALLDGMLFEVFFDPRGKLRDEIKSDAFDELFDLQKYVELKASFDFIADVLTTAQARFYVLPGKGHELAVTVATKKDAKGGMIVSAVYIDGTDVLRPGEDAQDDDDGEPFYNRVDRAELEKILSAELVVPSRLLKVTYTPPLTQSTAEPRYPMGWTTHKL